MSPKTPQMNVGTFLCTVREEPPSAKRHAFQQLAGTKLRSLTPGDQSVTAPRSTSRVQLANSGRRKSAPFITLNHTIDPSLPPHQETLLGYPGGHTEAAVRTGVAAESDDDNVGKWSRELVMRVSWLTSSHVFLESRGRGNQRTIQ